MKGKDFLQVARDLLPFSGEAHRRAVAIHAYYSLLLECRDVLARWGVPQASRHNVHSDVRLKFLYSTDQDLKQIGGVLERSSHLRNLASYNLNPTTIFSGPTQVSQIIQQVFRALNLLEQIDQDPIKKAAAIASLPP